MWKHKRILHGSHQEKATFPSSDFQPSLDPAANAQVPCHTRSRDSIKIRSCDCWRREVGVCNDRPSTISSAPQRPALVLLCVLRDSRAAYIWACVRLFTAIIARHASKNCLIIAIREASCSSMACQTGAAVLHHERFAATAWLRSGNGSPSPGASAGWHQRCAADSNATC